MNDTNEKYIHELYKIGNNASAVSSRFRRLSLAHHPNKGGNGKEFHKYSAAHEHIKASLSAGVSPFTNYHVTVDERGRVSIVRRDGVLVMHFKPLQPPMSSGDAIAVLHSKDSVYTYVAITQNAVYRFSTRDKIVAANGAFFEGRLGTMFDLTHAKVKDRTGRGWDNLRIRVYAGTNPRPLFLEKKTYESEFRAVDKRAPPLSQEAYEFLDELISSAVLAPLVAKAKVTSSWESMVFGYYDKNVPAVMFGKSRGTSKKMYGVGKTAMERWLPAVDFSSVFANVKTARIPTFSTLRIWKTLRMMFETQAETNHATAIVVQFIRQIYAHMKARGGPYDIGIRTMPGLKAKADTYARVRWTPGWLTWELPENYEISKDDIIYGLKTSGYDNLANFAAVFDKYAEIYRKDTRSNNRKFQNTVTNALKRGVKVSNDKMASMLKRGFRVSPA